MTNAAPEIEGLERNAGREAFLAGREMMLLFDLEGYTAALPLLFEARERMPGDPLVFGAVAECYSYWGSRRERNGEECLSYYALSMENARKAVELGPKAAEAHRAMAIARRAGPEEDAAERLSEARRAFDLNPYDAENCLELWRASGGAPDAPLILKAIALNPVFCGAHIDLGVALCERGRLDAAAYHLRRALEINPRNSLAQYDLAMICLRKGNLAEADGLLRAAAELYPQDSLILSGVELVNAEREGAEKP